MRFLVIGDVCEDVYHFGVSNRKNPESAAPLISTSRSISSSGMAANVARNLEALGAKVDTLFPPKPWSEKHRYIDAKLHQQLLRVDYDRTATPLDRVPDLEPYDAVVVSDYNKGFIDFDFLEALDGNIPVFLDTKKRELGFLKDTWVKINEHEYHQLITEPTNLIVTMAEKGSSWGDIRALSQQIDLVDPCGAGDTYLAAFAWSMIKSSGNTVHAMRFANQAAAITCLYRGTYAPKLEEIYC